MELITGFVVDKVAKELDFRFQFLCYSTKLIAGDTDGLEYKQKLT